MLKTQQNSIQDRVVAILILAGISIGLAISTSLQVCALSIPQNSSTTEFELPGESLRNCKPADVDPYLQAAGKAYASQDFKNAALNYERAARLTELLSMHTTNNPHQEILWFQKAVDSADKDSSFEKDDLARLLVELGDRVGGCAPLVFPLYSRAVSLMSDSNPKKPEILMKLIGLCSNMKLAEKPGEDRTLGYQEQAALLAEKDGLPTAGTYFMRLAEVEATIGLPDRAVAHCRHAIDLYASEDFLLGAQGTVVSLLADRGHPDEAEKLLKKAVDSRKATGDANGPEVAAQLCELLRFYAYRHEDDKAFQVLDEILACDIERFYTNETSDVWLGHRDRVDLKPVYQWASDATRSKQMGVAANVLKKLLAAQESALAPNDLHIATTLLQLGDVDYAAGDEKAALKDYQRGFDLLRAQYKDRNALIQVPRTYLDLLRKNGQVFEAQRLQELRDSFNRSANRD